MGARDGRGREQCRARVEPDLRGDIWLKLLGNISFNPISALTGATLDHIVADESSQPVVIAMMREAEELVGRLGMGFDISHVDVGGGLGVDYDGSRSTRPLGAYHVVRNLGMIALAVLAAVFA